MKFKTVLMAFGVSFLMFVGLVLAEESSEQNSQQKLTIAIFSRNKTTHEDYEKYADMLKSGLMVRLSDNFIILDKDDIVNTFNEEKERGSTKAIDLWSYLQILSETEQNAQVADRETNLDKRTIEDKSSSLRIAQSIGAKYFLVADLEEIVSNNIQDAVYGQQINDLRITADVAVKILDGIKGGTILADNVRVEKRLRGEKTTTFSTADIAQTLPSLMKKASSEVAEKFLSNIDRVRSFKSNDIQVNFKIKTNVKDAVVALDGVGIGSAPGDFQALSGVHRLKVTKDGYRVFERDINITANAEFSVSLEETSEGLDKRERKQDLEINVKQREAEIKRYEKMTPIEVKKGEAEAHSIKQSADAEKSGTDTKYKHGPDASADW